MRGFKDLYVDEIHLAAVPFLHFCENIQLGAAGGADAESGGRKEDYQGLGLVQGFVNR